MVQPAIATTIAPAKMKKSKPVQAASSEGMAIDVDPDVDPVGFLIAPNKTAEFEARVFERSPLLVRATKDRKAAFTGLFDLDVLLDIAAKREEEEEGDTESDEEEDSEGEETEDGGPLIFSYDLNASRYRRGVKQYPDEKMATVTNLRQLWADGYTYQVLQPQRFSDGIWRLVSALEAQLGCLVGCNAYLTPPQSQGLAPHHDDVELWICQTQGRKRWRLYHNYAGFQLPNKPSPDFAQDEVGAPIMDVTLEVGDVLYLPRGTIHQAVAQDEGSTHLTLSTYQNWSTGNLASAVINTGLMAQGQVLGASLPLPLRRSLPFGFIFASGIQADLAAGPSGRDPHPASTRGTAALVAGLRALADQLEADSGALLPAAVDQFSADFVRSRAPPHPGLLRARGPMPASLDARVAVRARGLFMLIPVDGPDDPSEPEGFVKLCTPMYNSRACHMLPSHDPANFSSPGGTGQADKEEGHCVHEEGAGGHPRPGPGNACCAGTCTVNEGEAGSSDDSGDSGSASSDSDGSDADEGEDEVETGLPGPIIPAGYAPVISAVLDATSDRGIKLRSLLKLAPHQDEMELMRLACTLWEDGVLCTVVSSDDAAKKPKKRSQPGGVSSDDAAKKPKKRSQPGGSSGNQAARKKAKAAGNRAGPQADSHKPSATAKKPGKKQK